MNIKQLGNMYGFGGSTTTAATGLTGGLSNVGGLTNVGGLNTNVTAAPTTTLDIYKNNSP